MKWRLLSLFHRRSIEISPFFFSRMSKNCISTILLDFRSIWKPERNPICSELTGIHAERSYLRRQLFKLQTPTGHEIIVCFWVLWTSVISEKWFIFYLQWSVVNIVKDEQIKIKPWLRGRKNIWKIKSMFIQSAGQISRVNFDNWRFLFEITANERTLTNAFFIDQKTNQWLSG